MPWWSPIEEALRIEIELAIEPSGGPVTVLVDPGQLESALLNLCLNAAHAMDGPGTIRLRVRADRDNAHIEVIDTGEGMTPVVLEHAMEPFFTARSDGTGTGLGLPMVYGFIRQSGGEVQIFSAPGQGTTVRMSLPRLGTSRPSAPADTAVRWRRVLVVEDDPADLRAHRATLAPYAGEIVTAASFAQGLARLDKGGFDLVVTDLSLDGAPDGWKIAEAALDRGAARAVAVVSGRLPERTPYADRYGPALVTLPKPLDIGALLGAVEGLHHS